MKPTNIIGMVIGVLSMALGLVWFDWKLSLVIFLAIIGNNMERKK